MRKLPPFRTHVLVAVALLAGSTVYGQSPQAPTAVLAMPNASGRWAQFQVVTSLESIPIIGEVESTMAALLLLDITQDGASLQVRETMCHLSLTSNSDLIQVDVPRAFAESLSGLERTGRMKMGRSGWRLELDRMWMFSGIKPDAPQSDDLPTDPRDPRVVDSDNDGKPGVTLQSRGTIEGAIYLAQRSWNEISGVFKGGQTIKGYLRWGSERRVLDADSIFLQIEAASRPHPSREKNSFVMVRVPADADCQQVAAQGRELFRPTKP